VTRLGVAAALVDGAIVPGDVALAGGRVEAVGLAPAARRGGPDGADVRGRGRGRGRGKGIAVAGFVDWQVNGFGGVHLATADGAGYATASGALAAAGIVWASPAFFSLPRDGYLVALRELAGVRAADPGCGFTGAHLEGPFLSPRWPGAHRPETFLDPGGDGEAAPATAFIDAAVATGSLAMVTLAPERPGALAAVAALCAAGVLVSLGHTDADGATCDAARVAGASALTHCWNAHRRFAPRDPGPAGWALSSPGVVVGLIADGIHVAPETLALTLAAAPGRVALTTDAVAPAGTDRSSWSHGGLDVRVEGGAARLADGTLAGSVATPTRMLRVLEAAGVGFADAVHALSGPQAVALGLGRWRMRPGDPGHVTVLDDDHSVLSTWRHGRPVA
jgi:N-acetylglucosamine-6-phosphate deacetylase